MALLRPQYEIFTAASATAAIDILRHRRVDLIIQDLGLPDKSGIELLRDVRASYDAQAKVIVVSGAGTVQSAQDAMTLGAIAYLLKPFNADELLELVHDSLSPRAV